MEWTAKKSLVTLLRGFSIGAGNEARTRDLNLGKVALYQLSYSRAVLLTEVNILKEIWR